MPRQERLIHPNFIEYTKFIVKHSTYASLPNKTGARGNIKWVSPSDPARKIWWDTKKNKLGLSDRASVARAIHPPELKGKKPCQICGKYKSIHYIYPNANSIKKLNALTPNYEFTLFNEDIYEVSRLLDEDSSIEVNKLLEKVFSIKSSEYDGSRDALIKLILKNNRGLSPGVMSNAPDRLDGFHTYNGCCRSEQDTGRHRTNLSRYTQDRRAYENWAEGNWKLANRLMGEYSSYTKEHPCPQCGRLSRMTADHIGPISLGFTHRAKFQPLCSTCNSQKNNRMTYKDIQTLMADEKNEQVGSWHSKQIWDTLKNLAKNDSDAWIVSKLMRRNLHYVLLILATIYEKNGEDFLRTFLHPEYSFKDYRFPNFNPMDEVTYTESETRDLNNQRNAGRYIRISFESLSEYLEPTNRSSKIWQSDEVDELLLEINQLLAQGQQREAYSLILEALSILAQDAHVEFLRLQQNLRELSSRQEAPDTQNLAIE